MDNVGIAFDIGGTWIKGAWFDMETGALDGFDRIPSPLPSKSRSDLSGALRKFADQLAAGRKIEAVAISTAGVVDYFGAKVELCAEHLKPLDDPRWVEELESSLDAPVVLCNDSECAIIGAAAEGHLKGPGGIALLVAGTGLGFSVWRNGRRWRPGRRYTLLGAVRAGRTFDEIVSVSKLADAGDGDLAAVLTDSAHAETRKRYFAELADVLYSAGIIHPVDEIILCGALVNVSRDVGFPLGETIETALPPGSPKIKLLGDDGASLQLKGAAALAKIEAGARKVAFKGDYSNRKTEGRYAERLDLQKKSALELAEILWSAEQEAGDRLKESLPAVAECAERFAERMGRGGRLIYVGCGTSGRVAAMDDIELSCTFGLPDDRSITLISGGIADASLSIETDFEEDASAVPETCLLNLGPDDIMVGISASSTAYYVRSALAHGRMAGALTVLISESPPERDDFFDIHIPLRSGSEVVAGSTRMKAGTATKKILNMLSTSTMILLGKIEDCYMIDVACVNEKLVNRAVGILNALYGWDKDKAGRELEKHKYRLIEIVGEQRRGGK